MFGDAITVREEKTLELGGSWSTGLLKSDVSPGGVMVESVTKPVNPFCELTWIRVELAIPAWTIIVSGKMMMLKSLTFTVIVAEWSRVPFVPVTVTTYAPAGAEKFAIIVSVEEPVPPGARVTVVVLRNIGSPAGETLDANCMVPEKPPRLVRKMVEFAILPESRKINDGVASIEKSRPVTATGIVRDLNRLPLVAVTVTL
jgi:hypothetical protein